MKQESDWIIFSPDDLDLRRSPMAGALDHDTYILGTFNPGMTRLPNGNLLLMIRIAEALLHASDGQHIHTIRWDPDRGFTTDAYELFAVDVADPRKFRLRGHPSKVMALTSLSWLLPVEISSDGRQVLAVYYDKAIIPETSYQEYGVEDARISFIGGRYYMTTCSVGAERHSTTLYTSENGMDYQLEGIVLDHQNKDMLIFEGLVDGKFHALTRPLGDLYFAYPPDSIYEPGPSINLAVSPDCLHWRPHGAPLIRPRRGTTSVMKVGGGTQPILTPDGWLVLYHGVQPGTLVGIYRTFWAMLDAQNPSRVLSLHDEEPLLESVPELTERIKDQRYLTDVVFSTGIADSGDSYLVASGENDLACRISRIPKDILATSASSP